MSGNKRKEEVINESDYGKCYFCVKIKCVWHFLQYLGIAVQRRDRKALWRSAFNAQIECIIRRYWGGGGRGINRLKDFDIYSVK